MGHRHMFGALRRDLPSGNLLDPLECIRCEIAITTDVADSNDHVLKYHETVFMLESLALHLFLTD